ncbi:hypothetical protein NDU88_001909 [Pleurodeles waltl]|uniref:Uncharacterized protein n=1 Tax=Pleurodeles waltl TaxID=8319 RepID=A0AAV7MLP3_PLEWA|nr:hypothetical protein NDU88_001909 [Pleurodeles waltl]
MDQDSTPSPRDSEKTIQNSIPFTGPDEREKATEDISPWEDLAAWEREDFHPFHFTFDFLQAFFSGLTLPPSPNEIEEAFQDISSPEVAEQMEDQSKNMPSLNKSSPEVAEQMEDQSKNMPSLNKCISWQPRRNLAAFRLFLRNLLPTFKICSFLPPAVWLQFSEVCSWLHCSSRLSFCSWPHVVPDACGPLRGRCRGTGPVNQETIALLVSIPTISRSN